MNATRWRVAGLFVLAVLVALLTVRQWRGTKRDDVLVLCGGSMRTVLEQATQRYTKAHPGDVILTSYGDSGELCAQIAHSGRGDIYICHDPFMEWASGRGLVSDWRTVASLDLVMAVPAGNPRHIESLQDLCRPGLRIAAGDFTHSTAGVLLDHVLKKLDYGDAIRRNISVQTKGHQERATYLMLGQVDAAFLWSVVASQYTGRIESRPLPREHIDAITSATYGISDLKNIKVTVGLVKGAEADARARRFYEFITTQCADLFAQNGFSAPKP